MTMYDVRARFDELAQAHRDRLGADLDRLIAEYRQRADRAHDNFVDRATHSLISHLEKWGEDDVWEYSPTGLRMLLRSAYNVFGTRMQAAASKAYEDLVGDLAELYFDAFGNAVGGIQMSVPLAPEIAAPVALGQTIALDFRDGWWKSWWRRTRGYRSFAKKFQALIRAETEDFMTQLKTVQTAELRAQAMGTLAEFLEEQQDILFELGSGGQGGRDMQALFIDRDEIERQDMLQSALDTLTRYAA